MELRLAATLIVTRAAGTEPPEFLAIERSAASRFAPGFVVFPGGVIEPGDATLAEGWFGSASEAARACALRELAEETGLVLSARGLIRRPAALPGQDGVERPNVRQIPEVARWIAPELLPVRFDARFFAARAGSRVEPTADGAEAQRAWWSPAARVLQEQVQGEAQLMWPTLRMLQALAECRTTDDVLALRVEQQAPPGTVRAASPPAPR